MRYGDVDILTVAEQAEVDQIATWNKRHYEGKTEMPIVTPKEVLKVRR